MDIAKSIMEFCSGSDGKYGFRWDYSGRGMFGRECVGVVCDNATQMAVSLMEYLSSKGGGFSLGNVCEDNMGKGHIVYFPDIVWEKDDIPGALEGFCSGSDGKYVFHKEYCPVGKEESFIGVTCNGMVEMLMDFMEFMAVNRIYDVGCELSDPEAEESEEGYVVYFPHVIRKG